MITPATDEQIAELDAKANRAKKSLGLGGWFVFPDGDFAFQITTASGPHRGLHVAQDMRNVDAEFVAAIANSYFALRARLDLEIEAVVRASGLLLTERCTVANLTERLRLAEALIEALFKGGPVLKEDEIAYEAYLAAAPKPAKGDKP